MDNKGIDQAPVPAPDHLDLVILPGEVKSTDSLVMAAEFRAVFGSAEAKLAKGVVYFFLSEHPVPRLRGQSRIIYIGKTTNSLYARYFRYANKLASKRSGAFYKHIVANFGTIKIGYVTSSAPLEDESKYFKKYISEHLEYPPKSRTG